MHEKTIEIVANNIICGTFWFLYFFFISKEVLLKRDYFIQKDSINIGIESLFIPPWARDQSNKVPTKWARS